MKKTKNSQIKKLFILGVMATALAGCDQMGLTHSSIAYVDVAKTLSDSPVGKQEAEHNQQVRDVLLRANNEAQAKYKTMPESQQQQSRAADALALNELWQGEQGHAREQSIKAITAVIEDYRVSHKLDVVMNKATVLAADKKNDITDEIIAQLKSTQVKYGQLPTVTMKEPLPKTNTDINSPNGKLDGGARN
ncbi:OmpH family outer membrane protein [Pseudomonas lundensis]|uniref:OmpH family outer membrane protein n=1 Tax=Serratia proteamaculans TaxID=28151 RepID=UPI0029816FF0|nr:OmpH family outer membrane protein [Serratia proteamaculans]MDW5501851.1 OmpH family outer membrane protein [Serratia proteamaculans]MDW5506912.1 OmpH family outer membrane protein [Pseudomonas lundensis]